MSEGGCDVTGGVQKADQHKDEHNFHQAIVSRVTASCPEFCRPFSLILGRFVGLRSRPPSIAPGSWVVVRGYFIEFKASENVSSQMPRASLV